MKKLFFVLTVILASSTLFAYDMEETLLGGKIETGLFAGPTVRFTSFDEKWGLMYGGRAGLLLNKTFSAGLAGYSLVSGNVKTEVTENNKTIKKDYKFSYSGLELGYAIEPDLMLHSEIYILLGAGSIEKENSSSFYVFEPGIDAVLNITKTFRMSLGAYYRLVSGVDAINLTNEKVNGPSLSLNFKLGAF